MKNIIVIFAILSFNISLSQQAWQQINDFLFETRIKTSYSTDEEGYFLLYNENNSALEFYKYDPILDSYEQKADFPILSNTSFTSFAIGDDGYVILQDNSTEEADILLYKYDKIQDIWEQKAGALFDNFGFNFGLGTAFSINDKGYFASNGGYPGGNFREYDPISDSWTNKSNYPGPSEGGSLDFTIGDIGYLAFGNDDFGDLPILWSYNQNTETWTQLENIPWGGGYHATVSFAIGDIGYLGMNPNIGSDYFLRYLPSSNSWEQVEDTGFVTNYCFSYSIGNFGYVGAGHFNGETLKKVWKLDPELFNINDNLIEEIKVYPNPTKGIININGLESDSFYKIYGITGKLITQGEVLNNQISINQLTNGSYILKIIKDAKTTHKLIIKE